MAAMACAETLTSVASSSKNPPKNRPGDSHEDPQNKDGTCASTGGYTTGSSGMLDGLERQGFQTVQFKLGPPMPGDSTLDAKIKSVIMRGDAAEMRAMIESVGEAMSPAQRAVLERAIFRAELTGSRIATEAARKGFDKVAKDAPFNTHGQKAFTDGKNFLTRDADSHSGGVWKMFDRFGRRMGTYDQYLERIGP
jgi:hypothetical protein